MNVETRRKIDGWLATIVLLGGALALAILGGCKSHKEIATETYETAEQTMETASEQSAEIWHAAGSWLKLVIENPEIQAPRPPEVGEDEQGALLQPMELNTPLGTGGFAGFRASRIELTTGKSKEQHTAESSATVTAASEKKATAATTEQKEEKTPKRNLSFLWAIAIVLAVSVPLLIWSGRKWRESARKYRA